MTSNEIVELPRGCPVPTALGLTKSWQELERQLSVADFLIKPLSKRGWNITVVIIHIIIYITNFTDVI